MSDPKLDDQLRRFLDGIEEDERRGRTNAEIIRKLDAVAEENKGNRIYLERISAEQVLMNQRLNRHGRRLRDIERRVQPDTQTAEEDTGSHSVAELERYLNEQRDMTRRELDRRRDSEIWWKRQRWMWIAGALGAIAFLALSTCTALVAQRLNASPAVAAPKGGP